MNQQLLGANEAQHREFSGWLQLQAWQRACNSWNHREFVESQPACLAGHLKRHPAPATIPGCSKLCPTQPWALSGMGQPNMFWNNVTFNIILLIFIKCITNQKLFKCSIYTFCCRSIRQLMTYDFNKTWVTSSTLFSVIRSRIVSQGQHNRGKWDWGCPAATH